MTSHDFIETSQLQRGFIKHERFPNFLFDFILVTLNDRTEENAVLGHIKYFITDNDTDTHNLWINKTIYIFNKLFLLKIQGKQP